MPCTGFRNDDKAAGGSGGRVAVVAGRCKDSCCFALRGLTSPCVLPSVSAPVSGRGLELDGACFSADGPPAWAASCASFWVASVSCIFSTMLATLLLPPDSVSCRVSCHTLILDLLSMRLRLLLLLGQSLPVLAHLLKAALFAGVSRGRGEAWPIK